LALFLFTRHGLIRFMLVTYTFFIVCSFSVAGGVLAKIIPYWMLNRFDVAGLTGLVFMCLLIEVVVALVQAAKQRVVHPTEGGWSETSVIAVLMSILILLSSSQFVGVVKTQASRSAQASFVAAQDRFGPLVQQMPPFSVFIGDWDALMWLPSIAPVTPATGGAQGDVSTASEASRTKVDSLTRFSLDADSQNSLADKSGVEYIVLETGNQDYCDAFNSHWTVKYFNSENQLCLLHNDLNS